MVNKENLTLISANELKIQKIYDINNYLLNGIRIWLKKLKISAQPIFYGHWSMVRYNKNCTGAKEAVSSS